MLVFLNLFLAKNPVPIRCPVAGKYMFKQKGDILFETRILGGVTKSPRPNTYCKQNISDLSVCSTDQKEIAIDETYCLSVDHHGKPIDIYSEFCRTCHISDKSRGNFICYIMFIGDPDYVMKCIGYWKENLKSYLITYDERDPYSKYHCWVYQRADLNRVLMSQAVGAFCDLNQDVTSSNFSEGAAVALELEVKKTFSSEIMISNVKRVKSYLHIWSFYDPGNMWKDFEKGVMCKYFFLIHCNLKVDATIYRNMSENATNVRCISTMDPILGLQWTITSMSSILEMALI